ncbi:MULTISPECIES: hypothetical protein [unclassified Ruegeria]|uniref:hypothetical protein n=1 Tax=unclassified Ruegeria TaxID=2625375 RepID=UPI001489AEB9|nr:MULTISPECIES: hypothetical protein [unclassified Ruegeria]
MSYLLPKTQRRQGTVSTYELINQKKAKRCLAILAFLGQECRAFFDICFDFIQIGPGYEVLRKTVPVLYWFISQFRRSMVPETNDSFVREAGRCPWNHRRILPEHPHFLQPCSGRDAAAQRFVMLRPRAKISRLVRSGLAAVI